MENVITEITIKLHEDEHYRVTATKSFSPEYGGGKSTIQVGSPTRNIHAAVDMARAAVTVSKTYREAFERENVVA